MRHTPAYRGYVTADGDNDSDEGPRPDKHGNDDRSLLETYPRKASRAVARMIASVVKRYYAATLAADGLNACALLSRGLATGLAAQTASSKQTAPIPKAALGACASAFSPLLGQQHMHLASEKPETMGVTSVRLHGALALATLGFKRSPESEILLVKEDRTWKIDALFDSLMP